MRLIVLLFVSLLCSCSSFQLKEGKYVIGVRGLPIITNDSSNNLTNKERLLIENSRIIYMRKF